MTNNNNLGLDQSMAVDPSIARQQQYVDADSRPPVDANAPSINPLPYEANTENLSAPMGGTILTSSTFNISDSGVQKVSEYSHNTSNQFELRARQAEQRARQTGRSIYQTPPSSGGAPSIQELPKPTEEQLSKLRKLESLRSINNKVRSLQLDEQRTSLKLSNIRNSIKALITEAEALTTSKTES